MIDVSYYYSVKDTTEDNISGQIPYCYPTYNTYVIIFTVG